MANDDKSVVVFGRGQPDTMESCGHDYSIAVLIDVRKISDAQTEIDKKVENYINYVRAAYGEIEADKPNRKTSITTIANITVTNFSPRESENYYIFSKSPTGPIYSIRVTDYEGEYRKEIDQILSTLKFLE